MQCRIRLSPATQQALAARLRQAEATGQVRVLQRIHVLFHLAAGRSVAEVAALLNRGEQTIRDELHGFLLRGLDSVTCRRPPGRPPKLTKTQRKELVQLLTAGPQAAGYATGCWSAVLIHDLLWQRFRVEYHPHSLCALLRHLGFSYQKARFASDHLDEAARQRWLEQTWPAIVRLAQRTGALILFGDEASFAQWGSLSYTWAPIGQQPTVKTSGKRKAYKVFGLIDAVGGRLFCQGHTGRFNAESYAAFLRQVLAQATQPLILIQDGAKYHTSKAMRAFFATHTDRLTVYQLPTYSPDYNPIEFLWKKVKQQATHLKYFPDFAALVQAVDEALLHFSRLPREITALMGRYCTSLGEIAA